jgi:RNA polymerase sigma-70 factor (ECF subfamily)
MAENASGPTESDDAELVRRFRQGDESAFRELHDRYGRIVQRRVEDRLPAHLRRKVSVADVMQESLLAAFDWRESLQDSSEAAFRAWLLTIAENKAVAAIRRFEMAAKRSSRREVTRARRPDTALHSSRQPTPSQIAVGAEMQSLAQHALRRLSPDYREILRLTRYEHLTVAEAAERMGRSYEASKKLYARAMARFHEEFEKLGGDTP